MKKSKPQSNANLNPSAEDMAKSLHKSIDFDYELSAVAKQFRDNGLSWYDVLKNEFGIVPTVVNQNQLRCRCPRCNGIGSLNLILNLNQYPTYFCEQCVIQGIIGNSLIEFVQLFVNLKRQGILAKVRGYAADKMPKPEPTRKPYPPRKTGIYKLKAED